MRSAFFDTIASEIWAAECRFFEGLDRIFPKLGRARRRFLTTLGSTISKIAHRPGRVSLATLALFSALTNRADRLLGQNRGGGVLSEFRNRILVFHLFESAPSRGPKNLSSESALGERIAWTHRELPPFERPWAIEGIAYDFAIGQIQLGNATSDAIPWLQTEASCLPESCFVPLHVAVGMALAEHTLEKVDSGKPLAPLLTEFYSLCDRHSLPGWEPLANEALGLIVGNVYPQHMQSCDAILSQGLERERRAFWHGVGRGLYFNPIHVFPFTNGDRRLVETLTRFSIALSPALTHQLVAGAAWAAFLVNLRAHHRIEKYLNQFEAVPDWHSAVHRGINSAAMVWKDCFLEDESLPKLIAQLDQPDSLAEPIPDYLRPDAMEQLLTVTYPALKSERRLAELFTEPD